MAQVKIAGKAMVITSGAKLEEIKNAEKYRPNALRLFGGEEGKELLFVVGTAKSASGIDRQGVVFCDTNADGYAQLTLTLPADVNPQDYVPEVYGPALTKLCAVEEQLPAALAEIRADKERVQGMIEVIA